MLTHMRIILIYILFTVTSFCCCAQYHAGIGGRVAKFNTGLTMKYFFRPDNATGVSLFIGYSKISKGGWVISPLYQHQFPFNIPLIQLPLDLITGIGMHVG